MWHAFSNLTSLKNSSVCKLSTLWKLLFGCSEPSKTSPIKVDNGDHGGHGDFFNCSSPMSVLRRRNKFNQPTNQWELFTWEFHATTYLSGCKLLFILAHTHVLVVMWLVVCSEGSPYLGKWTSLPHTTIMTLCDEKNPKKIVGGVGGPPNTRK